MREGPHISKPEAHLTGAKPIMACVGSFDDFNFLERAFLHENFNQELDGVENIDYSAPVPALNKQGILNGGRGTYVISAVNETQKFSGSFMDCTSLVVTGVDKVTGKNISFLTHQDPKEIFKKGSRFTSDLKERIREVKERCLPGTVDAVVAGGNFLDKQPVDSEHTFKENYLKSINLLAREVKDILGFEPTVINGPKVSAGIDNIYYDNEERRLYLLRGAVNQETGSFLPSEADSLAGNWKEKVKVKK